MQLSPWEWEEEEARHNRCELHQLVPGCQAPGYWNGERSLTEYDWKGNGKQTQTFDWWLAAALNLDFRKAEEYLILH